jgi:hypothetical protein
MFKYILGFSAFALASCAAFFSVKGIALLFAASFWSVAIMAGTMELAKLVSASYLYRYWNEANKILKKYMLIATILLMAITSLGIFGFLSDAFQRNFSQYSLNLSKINSLKSQQSLTVSQIEIYTWPSRMSMVRNEKCPVHKETIEVRIAPSQTKTVTISPPDYTGCNYKDCVVRYITKVQFTNGDFFEDGNIIPAFFNHKIREADKR